METKLAPAIKRPVSDDAIVALYWSRDEKAIEETDFKYRHYLFAVACNILHGQPDCEECLNDAYLAVWNAIPPAKPDVLKAFLTTIVRRIAINRYYSNLRHSEMTVSLGELESILPHGDRVEQQLDARELGMVLSSFVRSLPERQRFIFMNRYYIAEPVDAIARAVGLSRSMVNKELAAIRTALKEKLESEGYSL